MYEKVWALWQTKENGELLLDDPELVELLNGAKTIMPVLTWRIRKRFKVKSEALRSGRKLIGYTLKVAPNSPASIVVKPADVVTYIQTLQETAEGEKILTVVPTEPPAFPDADDGWSVR